MQLEKLLGLHWSECPEESILPKNLERISSPRVGTTLMPKALTLMTALEFKAQPFEKS